LNRYELSIWILEDYGTSKWTLKHKVTMLGLFGKMNIEIGTEVCDAAYRVLAYDMNCSKVHVLPTGPSDILDVHGNYYV
jgi:UDP-N-acetyl-D-mannosaminuronate dehydrogenase